ncbi:helix-turn-helix domain-containing protein [Pseudofrankia asymbiotica]|uniref:helix-turn-helix domain-containing protein n=1 Tax=Pseudofrankia asymbiotica TaxID=1834516 RepID=UPI0009D755CE|nr:helix-turn-helix transcriptional regulator [Pseudofrankia asymbiotica]
MTTSSESPPLLRRLVGDALRDYRMSQGRTLRDVAAAARVSVPYLSEVERGRKEASSEVLAAVCRGLGIRLSDLLEQVRRELVEREPRQQPSRAPVRPVAGSAPTRPVAGAKAPVARPAAAARPLSPAAPVRIVRAAEQAVPTPPIQPGPTCHVGAAHTPPARPLRALRGRGRHGRPGGFGPRQALAPIVPTAPGRTPALAARSGCAAGRRVSGHPRAAGHAPRRVGGLAVWATVTL